MIICHGNGTALRCWVTDCEKKYSFKKYSASFIGREGLCEKNYDKKLKRFKGCW